MDNKAIRLMLLVLILLTPTKVQAAETEKQQFITTESGFESKIIGYKYKWKKVKIKKTKKKYLGKFTITYYCDCAKCCGSNANGITSTGVKAKPNHTIAVDPQVIPYGSKVKIGNKIYVAEDCGGGIKKKRIDMFVSSHAKALKLGVSHKKVWLAYTVIKEKKVRVKCPILEN